MRDYHTQIRQHEAKMNELIAAIKETVKRRHEFPHAFQEWDSAADRLHEYGRDFYSLLKRCWTEGLEQDEELRAFTFSYLATDPYYFRSGYFLEVLVRQIKKLDLSDAEKVIIQDLILRRIDTKALRNFRDICRLIPRVETEDFSNEIDKRLKSEESSIRHRAELAASYLPNQGKLPLPRRHQRLGRCETSKWAKRRFEIMTAELRDLTHDLREIGVEYSLGFPLEESKRFEDAIPILLEHLQRDYAFSPMRIVSSELMSDKAALQKYWGAVADIFAGVTNSNTRYATDKDHQSWFQTQIASILIKSFTTEHLETLFELIRDPANGDSRRVLLAPLRRRRENELVKAFLRDAISEPFLKKELETWRPAIA